MEDRKMRIAYLMTTYPAVSHTFIRRELREMERRGHTILRLAIRPSNIPLINPIDKEESHKTLYCVSYPFFFHLIAIFSTFFSHPLKFFDALRSIFHMWSLSEKSLFKHLLYLAEACTFLVLLRKHSIQHVHSHFGTNITTIARLIMRCGGPKYSFTTHGALEFDSPASIDLGGKVADASFVVGISDFCSAQIRRWSKPKYWEKIHIVRCTVSDDFFESATPIKPEVFLFSCVGRLSPAKGQLVLIEAFSQVIKAGYDAQLIIVGDGELRQDIEQMILNKGLKDCVSITGYVSEADVRKFIIESRTVIIPSFIEGLPLAIMEAFALGRPVISTYVAGIPELVRPEENGWLVPASNIDELSKAVIESLELPLNKLQEMAENGRKRTRLYHTTKEEADKLETLFLEHENSV